MVRSTSAPLTVRCAVCRRTATASVVVADFEPLGRARWIQLPPGWWQLLDMAPGSDLHCRCAGCLLPPERPPVRSRPSRGEAERKSSARIEGRWYVTDRAAREYAHLMRPRTIDIDEATGELIELSAQAHFVRDQPNGLALWRVKASNGARIRLLVGPPDGVRGAGTVDALVQVLGEHGGVKRSCKGQR
jgi:hypothetical protein